MLKAISFFNLIFAVVYFLVYLQNGNGWIVLGLLAVVVFNWIVIRSLETGQLNRTALYWVFVLPDVSFGLFTGYNHIHLLIDVIDSGYYPWNTVRLITSGLVFATTILLQVFLSWFEFKLKKTD